MYLFMYNDTVTQGEAAEPEGKAAEPHINGEAKHPEQNEVCVP